MEHRDVVARRRMVRRYTGEPIPPETIERITTAMTSGPTAGNARGISVVAVTDDQTRRAVAALAGEESYRERGFDPWLTTAPAHLVLCVEPQRYHDRYLEPDKDLAALSIPWWWVRSTTRWPRQ